MRKCGAKTKKGDKCQNPQGHGTDHVGTGRCRLHGGASKGAPKGSQNALKHGIYSKLFSHEELTAAKEMQGSVENELAIARLQLFRLLQMEQKQGDSLQIDKVEEKTIVQDETTKEKEKEKKAFLKHLLRSAKEAGEHYDPDGDEDYMARNSEGYFFQDRDKDEVEDEDESEVFERKRTYQRRDFHGEFVRLTSLIARLEQQILHSTKTKAEIRIIEVTGNKTDDADDKLTDTELDKEIQELIGGFSL